MSETPPDDGYRRLLSTSEAARALGIATSTLSRWASAGLATPARRTVGGHMRWDLDELRHQLAEQGAITE